MSRITIVDVRNAVNSLAYKLWANDLLPKEYETKIYKGDSFHHWRVFYRAKGGAADSWRPLPCAYLNGTRTAKDAHERLVSALHALGDFATYSYAATPTDEEFLRRVRAVQDAHGLTDAQLARHTWEWARRNPTARKELLEYLEHPAFEG